MLVKNSKICNNQWLHLETEVIPDNGWVTLPLERWVAEHKEFEDREDPVGVRLLPESDFTQIENNLDQLQLIVIEFPVLADGRVFSFAKILRRKGYQGEIRAIGNFLTDQMYYLQHVGVDSFELPDTVSEPAIQQTLERFSVRYQ
ncbi:MAG TPA: DUF934 domain-containing protein [Crenotrichaceae bacterium]|nr:DUF934 domain-containing protein [Crenotrichaceae bacterium]